MDAETGEYCLDTETGEVSVLPVIQNGEYYLDTETGEISVLPVIQNAETGEIEGMSTRTFKIPSSYYNQKNEKINKPQRKPRIVDPLEVQLITASIFLLPTMIFFHPILSVILSIVEIVLHNWFHEKNKKLKNKSVYFQSPLHGFVKEMCARCKEENATFKIGQLQDLQRDRFKNYLRRVVT